MDAALFEPGQWKSNDKMVVPSEVPCNNRDHLFTPTGLLFNEIIMAPDVILSSIQVMMEKSIDMDTGRYSEIQFRRGIMSPSCACAGAAGDPHGSRPRTMLYFITWTKGFTYIGMAQLAEQRVSQPYHVVS